MNNDGKKLDGRGKDCENTVAVVTVVTVVAKVVVELVVVIVALSV